MADLWKELFKRVLANGGNSWNGVSDALKKSIGDYALKLATGDNTTLKNAIEAALKDNTLSKKEATGLLALLLKGWKKNPFFGNQYVQKLLDDLQDGTLDTQEIVGVAALWVGDTTKDNRLQRLLLALKDGVLDKKDLKEALDSWLSRISEDELKGKIDSLIDNPTPYLGSTELFLLLGVWLVSDRQIASVPDVQSAQLSALKNAINVLGNSDLLDALHAIADKDTAKAVRLILKKVGIRTTDSLVQAVIAGKIDAAAQEFLTGVFKRSISEISKDQASDLADTVIKIITGQIDLIPTQDEQQEFFAEDGLDYAKKIDQSKCPFTEYELFDIVRRILVAAKRSLATGGQIPGGAQAPLNTFQIAAVKPKTKVSDLVSDQALVGEFIDFVLIGCRQEFGKLPNGRNFASQSPLSDGYISQGITAKEVYDGVLIILN